MGEIDEFLLSTVDGAEPSFAESLQEQLAVLRMQVVQAEDRADAAEHLQKVAEDLAAQLQHALDSRIVIEQAKGILAERHGVGVDVAFDLLRTTARSRQRKLHDLAQAVVDGRETLDPA